MILFAQEGVEGPKVGKATGPDTSESKPFDLIVLGAGPAGVKAAIEAASRGYHVGVVEPQEKPTGAPTGAYSKCIREAVMAKKWTWPEIHDMVQKITAHAHENTMRLLHVFHIDVLVGAASFIDAKTVSIAEPGGGLKTFESFAFVEPLGGIPFDLPGVYDSDTISQIDFMPKSMVVQGAGIIGLEYANMFAKQGARVVVVEFADKMLQMLDRELQAALLADLAANNVEILLTTRLGVREVEGSIRGKPSLIVETSRGSFRCECLLSAVGRCGTTEGLGLEKLGVTIGRGKMIQVDENQHTGVANIYAVGDVAGGNLATIGQAQAVRAVRRVFGSGQFTLVDKAVKPFTVWTIPEISWAGLNEQEAEQKKLNFGVVRADYGKTVRGIVSGEPGFLKLIFDRENGKVLGVHICGAQASELINFGADAVDSGTTTPALNKAQIFEILQFVFPAVTFHILYNWAAAEAKIRMSGVKSLSGTGNGPLAGIQAARRILERQHQEEVERIQAGEPPLRPLRLVPGPGDQPEALPKQPPGKRLRLRSVPRAIQGARRKGEDRKELLEAAAKDWRTASFEGRRQIQRLLRPKG
eukprot:s6_g21.t1